MPANTETNTNTKHCPAQIHSDGECGGLYGKFSDDHNIAGSPSNTEYIILHHPTAQTQCVYHMKFGETKK